MSIQKRKIAYHNIVFSDGENYFFDNKLFINFIEYLDSLTNDEKIFNNIINKKAVSINSITIFKKEGMQFIKISFKSCKYNHNPDYMSSIDGAERPTAKQSYEGDKELTHMMMKITTSEAYTIFEERKSGVSIGVVIKYFNDKLKNYYATKNINSDKYLWAGFIPPNDFLTSLDNTKRISVADVYMDKEILGLDGLSLVDETVDCRDELMLTIKSKPRDTLGKRVIQNIHTKFATAGTQIRRIRVYGTDIDGTNVTLDTLNKKKVTEIKVELSPNGTVDSYSIFSKIEELFGVTQ